jgi:hypothetical protein
MSGRDDLVVLREFGTAVARALNGAGVVRPTDKAFCAVMVVVGEPGSGRAPVGGSLNYENGEWFLTEQLEAAERVS